MSAHPAPNFSTGSEETDGVSHSKELDAFGSLLTKAVAVFGVLFLGVTSCYVVFGIIPKAELQRVLSEHFLAVAGPIVSAIAATVVIAMFRASSGKIEFKAIGFEFKGASGPTVLWIFCYLACIISLYLLWPMR